MALRRGKDPLNEIQNCLQKRDYKGALPYFLKLLDKNPKNTQIRLRYADTLVLAGSKKEAIKQYRVVADELAEAGFIVRAIAINKKIVQLDPTQVAVHEKLATMNEERTKSGVRPILQPPPGGALRTTPPRVDPPRVDAPKTQPRVESPTPAVPVMSAEESWDMEFGSQAPSLDLGPASEPAEATSQDAIEIELEPTSTPGVSFAEMSSAGATLEDPFAEASREAPGALNLEPPLVAETPELELELIPDEEDEEDVATQRSLKPQQVVESSPRFSLADEAPSAARESPSEPPFEIGDVGLGREVASHFQMEDATEPEIDVEPDVVMEDAEPISSPGAEFAIDFETQADEAADGANPLVGLLGDDVDSLIDNIISDVSSSRAWPDERPEEPPTKIPLFSDLTTEEFIDVALMLNRRPVKAGAVVVQEGDPGDSMFIVSTGEVRAVRGEGGREVHLATLKDGDFFGEMAVLSGEPRRATVVAVKNSELLELSRDHLHEIFSRHPHVEAKIRLAHDERLMT